MSQVYQEIKKSEILIDDLSKIVGDYATGKISRIKGMLYGVALGDSLGIPHEFYTITPKIEYTGVLNTQKLTIRFQFASLEIPGGGIISDDSEMSIVLLIHIIQNKLK